MSVQRSVREVSQALIQKRDQFIIWPQTQLKINTTKQNFYNICRFPNIIGAIDCSHVPMLKPTANQFIYINRKGSASINCQGVATANLKFTNFVA